MKLIVQAEVYGEEQDGNGSVKSQRINVGPKEVLPLAMLFPWQIKIADVFRTKALCLTQEEYVLWNIEHDSGSP